MNARLHKKKYLENLNVVKKNFNHDKKNNGWKVTVLFYAAMHLVEGSFPESMRTEKHADRFKQISNLANLNSKEYDNIKVPYKKLYDYSINARYYDIPILDKEIDKANQCLKTLEHNLEFKEY
jgi:hypothetical protein